MPHSKRKQLEVAERRAKVLELYTRGLKQWEIARELGLKGAAGAMMVSRDLDAVKAGWEAAAVRSFDEHKGRLLCEIGVLKNELWESWDLSRVGKGGKPRPGDPRLAAQILDCIQEEAELLGLAPKRGESPSTSPPVIGFRINIPPGYEQRNGVIVDGVVAPGGAGVAPPGQPTPEAPPGLPYGPNEPP